MDTLQILAIPLGLMIGLLIASYASTIIGADSALTLEAKEICLHKNGEFWQYMGNEFFCEYPNGELLERYQMKKINGEWYFKKTD